jgi:hypothetical protein
MNHSHHIELAQLVRSCFPRAVDQRRAMKLLVQSPAVKPLWRKRYLASESRLPSPISEHDMRIEEPQSFDETCPGTSTINKLVPAQDVALHPASSARSPKEKRHFLSTKKLGRSVPGKNMKTKTCQEQHSNGECLEADSDKECREAYLVGDLHTGSRNKIFSRGVAGKTIQPGSGRRNIHTGSGTKIPKRGVEAHSAWFFLMRKVPCRPR